MFEALMASDRKLAYKIKRGAEIVLDESVVRASTCELRVASATN